MFGVTLESFSCFVVPNSKALLSYCVHNCCNFDIFLYTSPVSVLFKIFYRSSPQISHLLSSGGSYCILVVATVSFVSCFLSKILSSTMLIWEASSTGLQHYGVLPGCGPPSSSVLTMRSVCRFPDPNYFLPVYLLTLQVLASSPTMTLLSLLCAAILLLVVGIWIGCIPWINSFVGKI